MSDEVMAVIAGALIGIIPTMINKFVDARSENKKWEREQKSLREDSFRKQLGMTGKKLLQIQHAVNWMAWSVQMTPQKISFEQIEKYDQEVRQIFPEVMAELVEISIMSPQSHKTLNAEFESIIKIDAILAKLLDQHTEGDEVNIAASPKLDELLDKVIASRDSILTAIKTCLIQFNAATTKAL